MQPLWPCSGHSRQSVLEGSDHLPFSRLQLKAMEVQENCGTKDRAWGGGGWQWNQLITMRMMRRAGSVCGTCQKNPRKTQRDREELIHRFLRRHRRLVHVGPTAWVDKGPVVLEALQPLIFWLLFLTDFEPLLWTHISQKCVTLIIDLCN